jgi:flagellar P-ring protein precursor FlgI
MPSVERRSARLGRWSQRRVRCFLIAAAGLVLGNAALASERLKDISTVTGIRNNQLIGYGLTVGLDGTGDQTTQTPFTRQSVVSMLQALGVSVPANQNIQLKNTAAVIVTATLPPFSRPGQAIDVTVSSLGNAKSLRGGTLLMTPLRGADGQVYGMAQGNVIVGGASASTGGASVQINQLSAGRIPGGASVERAVPGQLDQDVIQIELARSDFSLMQRALEAIEQRFGPGVALPVDARFLQVRLPLVAGPRMAFLAQLEQVRVETEMQSPRVVINSRTGSVVMNQLVTLEPCAVSHGSLTIRVTREPQVSQPQPFSRGETVVTSKDSVAIDQPKAALVALPGAASLDEVVRALNLLGANVTDLISILQALKTSGALRAEIEVI